MSKKGIHVAETLSDFANASSLSGVRDFVDSVTTEHRFLQEEMFKMMQKCIEKWAKNYDENNYDDRNQYTVRASKVMVDALKENKLL